MTDKPHPSNEGVPLMSAFDRAYSPAESLYAGRDLEDLDALRQPGSIAKYVYLGLAIVPIAAAAALLLVRQGLTDASRGASAPWDLGIVLVCFVVTLTMSTIMLRGLPRIYERARGGGLDQTGAALEFVAILVAVPVAISLSMLAVAGWAGAFQLAGVENVELPTIIAGFAMVIACLPVAIFSTRRAREIRLIEQRFPDLLRDLNESHSVGLTMAQAVRVAARGDYGRLNPEVRRMAAQVSWGRSFSEALSLFAHRVGTPLIERSASLIVKATRAGGNVNEVLAAAARDAREIKSLERERSGGMLLYVVVIYVAFAVFLAVVAALQGLLIPSMLTSTRAAAGAGSGFSSIGINHRLSLQDFHFIYYAVGLVQAIGSGVVAGAMSEGTLKAGLKHTTLLVGATIVALGILL